MLSVHLPALGDRLGDMSALMPIADSLLLTCIISAQLISHRPVKLLG